MWLKIFLVFTFSILFSPDLNAQDRFGYNQYQFIVYAGSSHFFGDLGGRNKKGSSSPLDLDIGSTGVSIGAGVIRKINNTFSIRANYIQATLRGSDYYTDDKFRRERNLSFRTIVEEISISADVTAFTINKNKKFKQDFVGFLGIGVFAFNPQANYKGKWHNLQPLGTEGQGLIPGKLKYNRVTYNIPFGFAYNINITERQKLGLILTMRKTFTDYLDDVSTNYYDNKKITEAYGEIAGILADRNLQRSSGILKNSSSGRGNPKSNDNFAFLQLTYSTRFYLKKKKIDMHPFQSDYKVSKCYKKW